jgi:metallophosphoesterase (TIGR03767 family)
MAPAPGPGTLLRKTRTRKLAAFAAAAVLVAVPALAVADPAGRTTLDETIQIGPGEGFRALVAGPGEPYMTRRLGRTRARPRRARTRRSLLLFGQVTDPQTVDELSPARADFADPIGRPLQDANRPQEALGTQVFDQIVRNINMNSTSPVPPGAGRRGRLRFVIGTGDLADNMQLNETRWYVRALEGGLLDPFSGQLLGPNNPCPQADAPETARLNADVAARNYSGVQDYGDYPGVPPDRYGGFWDPDEAPPEGGAYAVFPRYQRLLDRAQQPFEAAGLDVPWYAARGNHDGLIAGNLPGTFQIARILITGCSKIFPSERFDPARYRGRSEEELLGLFANSEFQQEVLSGARRVPPDPDRRFVSTRDFKAEHGSGEQHGFAFVNRAELQASNNTAAYYAWTPRRGIRFVSLDTVSEGGTQNGNIDDPQFKWLRRELDRNSSTEVRGRRVRHDRDPDRLIVVYGHHTLNTMTSTRTDEQAGTCSSDDDPSGCDADPRISEPVHRGLAGPGRLRDLFLRFPNVVAYVAGHTHENHLTPYRGRRGGFWEINTASHSDFPHQSRLIEIMDNRDGTLSLFGTLLDSAAPINPPPSGDATAFNEAQLASISRLIAANDPQGKGVPNPGYDPGLGRRRDRNAELVLADPRRLAR